MKMTLVMSDDGDFKVSTYASKFSFNILSKGAPERFWLQRIKPWHRTDFISMKECSFAGLFSHSTHCRQRREWVLLANN